MTGYISESFRFYQTANNTLQNYTNNTDALVCLVFSALYLEGVLNDIIFEGKLMDDLLPSVGNLSSKSCSDIDLYKERKSPEDKIKIIFDRYQHTSYKEDIEYKELMYLHSIRSCLVHLKPTEQLRNGKPKVKLCNEALAYLRGQQKIIKDPYAKGVYWCDVLMNKKVAVWSLNATVATVEYLYYKTFTPPFGINILNFHCLRLGIGKYRKHNS